jgi:RimJ/RimL family protein N-acetyltransferase
MDEFPVLKSKRLMLRQFAVADAADVQRFAGDRDVASTTSTIPHPYLDGMAEQWISKHQQEFEAGAQITFAIVQLRGNNLVGAIGLSSIDREHDIAEIGYWIGKPFWSQGYCTEAGCAVLKFGFDVLGLNRIHARHFKRNPASGSVMQKMGMTYEGCFRQHFKKWGNYEDILLYGILKHEYSGGAE